MKLRVGHGYDVHRFGPGDHVVLAGVRIPHGAGLVAHSDGDVLIHALCDALFGAAGLGDIGRHFPDINPEYRNADSRVFLRRAMALLRAQHWDLVNADLTLIAQAPRIASHQRAMLANLSADLGADPGQINIKGTTTEGLGFTGRGEGIACHAVVLIGGRD
ncbi:MAG: 2-C-methyl-D-erythritol 2,4-cyclodiphosphate synthase [Pseudomonadota bacterium]|jgi:2-C-methyl-D-erythritol 2,4-cyclodiphosphate synthase